ncbi:hypothetical protein BJ165DRAFT_1615396 [Panaeolus papilionaceus]|nr:hypothetical protein BJ165DRAFT_1615396 [Panaeolus papilionaceus]
MAKCRVTGSVSLERVDDVPWTMTHVTLLIGSTGVGKSNFLECLHSDDKSLGIAGNSLESVTQDITCYKVHNVRVGLNHNALYILDCPGFQDNQLSEMAVVKKLQVWCRTQRAILPISRIGSVLYLHRITDKRLSGTQRQTLHLISALLGTAHDRSSSFLSVWIGVVTTMWDTLWREDQLRSAEERFEQLRNEHLQINFGALAGQPLRFHNTHESAIHVLVEFFDTIAQSAHKTLIAPNLFASPLHRNRGRKMREAPFALNVWASLEERMSATRQRLTDLDELLRDEATVSNPELVRIYEEDRRRAEALLGAFEREKEEFLGATDMVVVRAGILQRLKDINFGGAAGQPFQFHNTHESAIHIVDQYFGMMMQNTRKTFITPNLYTSPLHQNQGKKMREAPFALNIYASLEERIVAIKQTLRDLDALLQDEATISNPELLQIYLEDKQKAEPLLAAFEVEKDEFLGPPELPNLPVVRSSIKERLKNALFRNR